jgi:hypothetical protein
MNPDFVEDQGDFTPLTAEKGKVSALWTVLHLIKKRSPNTTSFSAAQYIVLYLQFLLWPFTQAATTLHWRPDGMFTFMRAFAKLVCGTDWAASGAFVILVLVYAVGHAALFVAMIFWTKLRHNKGVATWLGVYFSFISYGPLMISISTVGSTL